MRKRGGKNGFRNRFVQQSPNFHILTSLSTNVGAPSVEHSLYQTKSKTHGLESLPKADTGCG
jgi:hypothetical protein